jgi:uncharacterized phage protein (TIGR01671 family)
MSRAIKFREPMQCQSCDNIRFRYQRWERGKWRWNEFLVKKEQCCTDWAYDYLENNNQIEQFTGLHDKNRVEIYEGDIIKCRHITSVHVMSGMDTMTNQDFSHEWKGYVKWQSNSCSFTIKHLTRILEDTMLESHEYEIIGNVHQNSDLIE